MKRIYFDATYGIIINIKPVSECPPIAMEVSSFVDIPDEVPKANIIFKYLPQANVFVPDIIFPKIPTTTI